jgi:hypothetical protein
VNEIDNWCSDELVGAPEAARSRLGFARIVS